MQNKSTKSNSADIHIISWLFSIVFLVIGVLNVILVSVVPGVFYFLLSLIYVPQTNIFLSKKIGFTIPIIVKIIVGVVVLWGTLAVGDLGEVLGL